MSEEKIELTGQELWQKALDELISDPTAEINQSKVAKKAGRTHSVLRKASYADVKKAIIKAQEKRDIELKNLSYEKRIEELEYKLSVANTQIKNLKEQNKNKPKLKDLKATEGELIARLTEMYRYNDALRFQLIEKHQTDIDEETGEILHVEFGRKK